MPMKNTLRSLMLVCGALALLSTGTARAELIYATNGSVLVRFDSATPGTILASASFTGLQTNETIVGIDLRPSNGLLYGVGSLNRIYIINPTTGAATPVGASGTFSLNGTAFGTDFNPVPDRIRQVSNTEQNLRLNPNDGTLTATDGALNPAGNVVAVAYSNNVAGASTTTLYSIDSASGTLGIISVPNSGGPINTVGSLGLGTNLNENIGFDISGLTAVAYASINVGGAARLYTINLANGTATLVGNIGNGSLQYLGLTAATAIPEPSSVALIGLAGGLFALVRLRSRKKS